VAKQNSNIWTSCCSFEDVRRVLQHVNQILQNFNLTDYTGLLATLQKPIDHTHQSSGSGIGGKLDHGLALDGLADDDHEQYYNATRLKTYLGVIDASLISVTTITYDIGSSAKRWLTGYFKFLDLDVADSILTTRLILPAADVTYNIGAANKRYSAAYIDTLHYGTLDPAITPGINLTDKIVISTVKTATPPFYYLSCSSSFTQIFRIRDVTQATADQYFLERAGMLAFDLHDGTCLVKFGVGGFSPWENLIYPIEDWTVTPVNTDCGKADRNKYGNVVWRYDKYAWSSEAFVGRFQAPSCSTKKWNAGQQRYDVLGYSIGGVVPPGIPTNTVYVLDPYNADTPKHYWQRETDFPVEYFASGVAGVVIDTSGVEHLVVGGGDCGKDFYIFTPHPNGLPNQGTWAALPPIPDATVIRYNASSFSLDGAMYVMWGVGGAGYATKAYQLKWYGAPKSAYDWAEVAAPPGIGREYASAYANGQQGYGITGLGNNDTVAHRLSSMYKFILNPANLMDTAQWTILQDFPGSPRSNAYGVSATTYNTSGVATKVQSVIIGGDHLSGFVFNTPVSSTHYEFGERFGDMWLEQPLFLHKIGAT
jgi:hypothetical protein